MKKFTYAVIIAAVTFGCSPEPTSTYEEFSLDAKGNAAKGNTQESLDVPSLSCGEATKTSLTIVVTAGATGAAGGFDIHWMTEEDFVANNSEWGGDGVCETGFSGNGNDIYSLGSEGSLSLNLEDMVALSECGTVECGVTYVFRIRAKNEGGQGPQGGLNKSDWSENFFCATASCEDICTFGKGWWRNHSTDSPGNQENLWPVDVVLKLGDKEDYTQDEWNFIFDSNNKDSEDYKNSNGLVNFAQHLMAAKLNVANGVNDSEIASVIVAADELIADEIIPGGAFTVEEKEASESLKEELEAFNESNPCVEDADDDSPEE